MSPGAPFRVGLSRDILAKSGEPSFGRGPLALLDSDPRIEWEFVPESVGEITPDVMARYDGLYVNSPGVTAASVARDDALGSSSFVAATRSFTATSSAVSLPRQRRVMRHT
jgi:hypothetical protein